MPSLYANLLDPSAPKQATISGAPVKYDFKPAAEPAVEDQAKKAAADAALRFQPIKRPQVLQKPKPRPVPSSSSPDTLPVERKPPPSAAPNAGSIERWTNDDDFDEHAAEYNRRKEEDRRRQKWAQKKRKKKKKDTARIVDFDEIYDPQFPIRLEDYKGSDEQAQAESDWKQKLHEHQFRRQAISSAEEEQDERMPRRNFAPPPSYNFAPPAFDDAPLAARQQDDAEDYEPAPAMPMPDDAVRDDVLSRRMRMNTGQPERDLLPIAAPGLSDAPQQTFSTSAQPVPAHLPPSRPPGVISAAPVRYDLTKPQPPIDGDTEMEDTQAQGGLGFTATAPDDDAAADPTEDASADASAEDQQQPRSNRPGQKGFAKRLLQKYGWQEGQGLGAQGSGITTILRHQAEKRKKRSDADGGGWAAPAAMGRIVGGKKRKTDAADGAGEDGAGESQAWSIVARFEGMLLGVDVELAIREHDLMQRVGDKMAEYGHVERLYVDRDRDAGAEVVFVKFTSALSAFRAIQASSGNDFLANGNVVRSAFFDADKFEMGVYE